MICSLADVDFLNQISSGYQYSLPRQLTYLIRERMGCSFTGNGFILCMTCVWLVKYN